jgi:hypothetical protein
MPVSRRFVRILASAIPSLLQSQQGPRTEPAALIVLRPARLFDGESVHDSWAVRVNGDRI